MIWLLVSHLSDLAIQVYSGWVEMEQRVWLRLKWIRHFAMIDPTGLLKISSHSFFDKCEYQLAGAQAVLIDGAALEPASGSERSAPRLQIRLNPTFQLEEAGTVTFRLLSTGDIGSWILALGRFFPFASAAAEISHAAPTFATVAAAPLPVRQ